MPQISQMPYSLTVLTGMIERDQSALLRPLSVFFGWIMNFFFNIAYFFTANNSLGVSIILVTFAIRFIMLPLAMRSQKSMAKVTALQPEVNKIREKYADQKDRESQAKMAQEIQALYTKNNASMFGGCLPLLIQMPVFFALNFIMRQSFLFITSLGELYNQIAAQLYLIPNRFNVLVPLAAPRIPNNMEVDLSVAADLSKLINKFTEANWNEILTSPEALSAPAGVIAELERLLAQKESIEMFFGINLLENSGTAWPGILIPICSALFMFLSSHLMNRRQKAQDPQQKTMQRMMTIFMPLVIGWSTINFPAGVGLYWTVSNVFQIGQQIVLDKFYHPKDKPDTKEGKIVKVVKQTPEKTRKRK